MLSSLELAFGAGALVMTCLAGIVLWPVVKKVLSDTDGKPPGPG